MRRWFAYSMLLFFLIGAAQPAHAQIATRRVPDETSPKYQGLVRKNLELRQELRDLEGKYISLENERKILILHVKDLQLGRDATDAVIQELKSKIASLRIEMLKDPKTAKTMDDLNKKAQQAQEEKTQLQTEVDRLTKEKKGFVEELKQLRELNAQKEASLAQEEKIQEQVSAEIKKNQEEFEKKLKGAREEFKSKEEDLKRKNQQLADDLREIESSIVQAQDGKVPLQDKVDELTREKEKLVSELNQLRESNTQKEVSLAQEEKTREQATDEVKKKQKEFEVKLGAARNDFERKEEGLIKRNELLENDLRETKQKLARAEKSKVSPSKGLEQRLASLSKEMEDVKAEKEKFKKENEDLDAALARAKESLEDAKTDLRRKTDEIERISEDQAKKNENELKRSGEESQAQLNETSRLNEDLRERNWEMTKELKEAKSSLEIANALLAKKAQQVELREEKRQEHAVLKREAEKLKRQKEKLQKENRELEQRLDETGTTLKFAKDESAGKDGDLAMAEKEIREFKKINAHLNEDLEDLESRVQYRKQDGDKKTAALNKEIERLNAYYKKDVGNLDDQLKEANKNIVRLEVDLKRVGKNKKNDERKMLELEEQAQKITGKHERLIAQKKNLETALKKVEEEAKKFSRETVYDKEYLKQKLKNATADRMMFEAKSEELQERAAGAEGELAELKEELEMKVAEVSLRDSENMVLREEKSKLERKLIRYIEKIIESESDGRKNIKPEKRGAVAGKEAGRIPEARTKRQVDQRKLNMHYNLAIAYDRRGMYKEEETEYLKCLRINPKDANVHYNLAILYDDKLNNNNKAIEHYRRFMELRPIGEDSAMVKGWMLHAEQEERLGPEMR